MKNKQNAEQKVAHVNFVKKEKTNCGKLRQNRKISLSFSPMPAVGTHGLPNQVPWGPTCWRGFRRDLTILI